MRRLLAFLAFLAVLATAAVAQGQSWPDLTGSGVVRSAAVCTTETLGVADELCVDSTGGAGTGLWYCPSPGDCNGTTAWERVDDTTGAGGQAVVLDIGDDGGNDSIDVGELATSGDTNSIFTEPTADKILIDLSKAWPKADALAANGGDCSAGSYPLGVDAAGAIESCTDATTEIDSVVATHDAIAAAHHAATTVGAGHIDATTEVVLCIGSGKSVVEHDNAGAGTCKQAVQVTLSGSEEDGDSLVYNVANGDFRDVPMSGHVSRNAAGATTVTLTFSECFPIYAPSAEIGAADDIQSIWRAPAGIVITEVWCETDTGTVNLDLQIDDGTPADVMGVDLVCASTAVSDSTGLTGGMAADDRLDWVITSVATNPTRLTVCIKYDFD